jgi:hypothetical protein
MGNDNLTDEAAAEMIKITKMSHEEQDAYFKSLPPDGTSTLLVADLEKLPASPERDRIIKLAKEFWYDDFRTTNEVDVCPKIALVNDLRAAGADFEPIAVKAMRGDYDHA